MRKRGRVDGNQAEIVRALRQYGATVESLANEGGGVPDLLVGIQGRNLLMDVKDGKAKPSQQRLTADEKEWHANWRGSVWTVRSVAEALAAVSIGI